jgi:hypothetical protein
LSQSQVLKGQVTAFSKSCNYENGQSSQYLDHGLECGGNDLNNQWISSRWSFGEVQVVGLSVLKGLRKAMSQLDGLLLPNVAKLQKQLQEVRPN